MIEPDLPCNIGDGIDPIDKEFWEWYDSKICDEYSLCSYSMLNAWNAAWHKYSPKISEDCLLTHIGRLILYHRSMKVDKEKSKAFIEVLNEALGIK